MIAAVADQALPDRFDAVEIETISVADGVHMLLGRGGNIGVVSGPDGVLLIDDQFAPLTEKIRAAVAAIGAGSVRFVLNTHWHSDHTGGNENFGKAGAVIVAHDNVRERMRVDQHMAAFGRDIPASPPAALPIVTFPGALRFHLNGKTIEVEHAPAAHTDGDAMVWIGGDRVLHLGDLYFNGRYPFVDVDSGGSVDGVIAAVNAALGRLPGDAVVIPGHGPLSNRVELEAYRDLLVTVSGRIREAIAAGRSEDEVVAAAPSAEFDDVWGQASIGPERFVRMLYGDLSRGR